VLEVEVADRRGADGYCRSGGDAIERSGDHDTGPSVAVPRGKVGDGGDQVAEQVDGSTAVDVGKRDQEERPNAGKDNVHGEFCRLVSIHRVALSRFDDSP